MSISTLNGIEPKSGASSCNTFSPATLNRMLMWKDSTVPSDMNGYRSTTGKTWRNLNFFQYQCYLHAWIPRVDIGDGKVRQVQSPWEGHAAGFTLLLEALMLELVRVMPVHCKLDFGKINPYYVTHSKL